MQTSQDNTFVCVACSFVQYKDAHGMPIAPDYAALSQPQYNPHYGYNYGHPQTNGYPQSLDGSSAVAQSGDTVIQPQVITNQYRECPYCKATNFATASFCYGCQSYIPPEATLVNQPQAVTAQQLEQPHQQEQTATDTYHYQEQYQQEALQAQTQDYVQDSSGDTKSEQTKTLTQSQKNLYFGIGFIAAIVIATVLLLSLNFVQVSFVSDYFIGFGSTISVRSNGFFFLIGIFSGVRGFSSIRPRLNNNYSQTEFIRLSQGVSNSAALWFSAIFMLLLFGITVWLLVDCIRKVIKKQNIVESNFFFIRMFAIAGLYVLLFILSLVINSQLVNGLTDGGYVGTTRAFTFSWLPIIFFAAAFVVAYIVLYKPNASSIDKSFEKFKKKTQ